MKRPSSFFGPALRACAGIVGSFALWTLWLALTIVLAIQAYIATTHELAVPQFILQRLEARLLEAGLRASFSRTSLDPTGRVLVENVRLSPVAFSEPVVQARAVYVRLNPWMLAVGQVEPREIRITGATAAVPTMLSGTGRPEEIVRDFDATLLPADRQIAIPQLSARVGGIAVSGRGLLPLPRLQGGRPPSLAEFFAQRFPALCRQAMGLVEKLAALDAASLALDFAPAESGALAFNVAFSAQALKLEQPVAVQAREFRIESRVLLLNGEPTISRIDAEAAEFALPLAGGITARGAKAAAYGRLRLEDRQFEAREVEFSAARLEAGDVALEALALKAAPRPLPRLDATLSARLAGSPVAVRGEADFEARSARLHFDGSFSPQILDLVGRRLQTDLRRFLDFAALDVTNGEVRLGPGWKFEQLGAQVSLTQIRGRGVTFDEGRATVAFDGRRFHAPEAFARIGENFARGSYEQEVASRRFRFLLEGRLRPMDISPWFQAWWPNFFRQLEFPAAPPNASVDVSGVWREGRQAAVFVHADAPKPIVRGAAFDRIQTRLFIRPGYFEGLDLLARRDEGALRGSFTYALDPASRAWRTFDVMAESSLDLDVARQIGGPPAARLLAPFKLANAPELRLRGHFDGPASPAGRHHDLRIEASTAGDFRFQNFPLQDASFTAALRDDEIAIDKVEARFGGGTTTGRARVWGTGAARRVNFDFALKDAGLGQAAAALEEFIAFQRNRPPAPPGKYVQEKANVRLDLTANAEGTYANVLGYRGQGTAALHGAEIGQVPLLGALSELLKFTSLRLTSAQTSFRIEGPKLVFPDTTLRGSDAAIDAHGEYALDRHQFDFNAKLFPFQESGNLIKTVVGAVLTPLSNAFEVKLSGTLAAPEWRLVLGPSNLLRSLAPDAPEAPVIAPEAGGPPPSPVPAAPEPARPVPPS